MKKEYYVIIMKKNRSNSEFKDYLNKIYKKPWGKEYLSYQTKEIGIWILHVPPEGNITIFLQ